VSRSAFVAALVRFQLQAGSRVALRTLAPVAAGAVAAAVMYGSPTVVILIFTGSLFPPHSSTAAAILATALALAVAVSSAPRLTAGLSGWARHLPASGTASRRAATVGLVVAQTPVLVLVVAGGLAALALHQSAAWPRLVAMVPFAWATSLAALSVERPWMRVLATAAALLLWKGTWTGVAVGTALAAVADLAAGSIAPGSGRRTRRRRSPVSKTKSDPGSPGVAAAQSWWSVSRRALGVRLLTGPGSGLLVLLPLFLFLLNNELSSAQQAIALRLAATSGIVVVMAVTADGLVKLRPPWPWIRSLPWPALWRVSLDAALLGVVAAPVFVIAALFKPGTVWVVAGALPLLGLRGAAAIRQAPGRLSAASGQLALEGMLVAVLVALTPWTSLLTLALVPVAARQAAALERYQEVSQWHELHHFAAGDPQSWSGA
jgi:hypothetical protein